jgi:PPOX class probable F420-dependent enzyme
MHLESLISAQHLNLATFRKSGVKVPTPVWAAYRDAAFYVFTESKSGKVKRLKNSPRAQLATCTARGQITGAWFEAEAHIVTDADEIEKAYQALRDKYGWKMQITDLLSKAARRYDKRAILRIQVVPS